MDQDNKRRPIRRYDLWLSQMMKPIGHYGGHQLEQLIDMEKEYTSFIELIRGSNMIELDRCDGYFNIQYQDVALSMYLLPRGKGGQIIPGEKRGISFSTTKARLQLDESDVMYPTFYTNKLNWHPSYGALLEDCASHKDTYTEEPPFATFDYENEDVIDYSKLTTSGGKKKRDEDVSDESTEVDSAEEDNSAADEHVKKSNKTDTTEKPVI